MRQTGVRSEVSPLTVFVIMFYDKAFMIMIKLLRVFVFYLMILLA